MSVCAHASALAIKHRSAQAVLLVFIKQSLRDDNGVPRFQDEILINRFALDKGAIVHCDLLLLAAFVAQDVNPLGVGELGES